MLEADFEYSKIKETNFVTVIKIIGDKVEDIFKNENGGIRWNRVSPTEKKGRVHSSTITVVALKEKAFNFKLDRKDIKMSIARGSGKGGQKRNKTETAVQMIHIPTGISVKIDSRSQTQNKEQAFNILEQRVREHFYSLHQGALQADKKKKAGVGMRADKFRTVREQDGIVINHNSNSKIRFKDYMKGDLG